jgi:hypothetical protein
LGGRLRITSSEDGLSASGGESGTPINSGSISISFGYLYINALGDGIDSNGNITISGGTTIINGPTANNNGPLDIGDHGYSFSISGGILIAVGSKQMAINANQGTQNTALFTHNASQLTSSSYVITDNNDVSLFAFKPIRNSYSLLVSAPDFAIETYKIYLNSSYQEATFVEDGFMDGGTYTAGTLLTSWSFSTSIVRYSFNG